MVARSRFNEKGLTLIELLAVIVILAIIAAIAIPAIGNIIENSRYNAAKTDALNVLHAATIYFADNAAENNVDVTVLKSNGYLDSIGTFESDQDANVVKANGGHQLTATVYFSRSKLVNFNGATVSDIKKDNQKGSAIDFGDTLIVPVS